MKNKTEIRETLKRWLLETIRDYYKNEIDEVLDDYNDKIYEIIDELAGDQLYINWYKYEYILDFYTDEDLDNLGVEDLDKNDVYSVLFAIFNQEMIECIDEVREILRNKKIDKDELLENIYKTITKTTGLEIESYESGSQDFKKSYIEINDTNIEIEIIIKNKNIGGN